MHAIEIRQAGGPLVPRGEHLVGFRTELLAIPAGRDRAGDGTYHVRVQLLPRQVHRWLRHGRGKGVQGRGFTFLRHRVGVCGGARSVLSRRRSNRSCPTASTSSPLEALTTKLPNSSALGEGHLF